MVSAAGHLLGTMEHSVLGTRWVYDASADPVFVSTVISVIASGGHEAHLEVHRSDGTISSREPTAQVRGSGSGDLVPPDPTGPLTIVEESGSTSSRLGGLTLTIARLIGTHLPEGPALTATFAGGTDLTVATASVQP